MKNEEILSEGLVNIRLFVSNSDFKKVLIKEGEYIIKQNQKLDCVFWSSVSQYTICHTSQNGKTLSLGDYYSEDRFFGEVELFSNGGCQFDVIATADTELVAIPVNSFVDIMSKDGKLAFWINRNMANIYQESMSIAIERTLYPLKFNILKDFIKRQMSKSQYVNHEFMYQEAQRFGCTDRAYNRVIHELIDDGVMKKNGSSSIELMDIDRAEELLLKYYR